MEKRSSKSPAIIEPNQLGCVWRFSGMFNYHQGSPNQKLLLDGSHVNKTLAGPGYTRSQVKLLTNFDEQCKGISTEPRKKTISVDGGERSMNKFMERERTSLRHVKQHKKAREDARIAVHQDPSYPMPIDVSSHDEGFCNQIPRKNGRHSSLGKTKQDQVDEKKLQLVQMSAETFIDQMFVDGKYLRRDQASHQSRQFLDALDVLNSNKELFLKLLQDPNSLLVKHIQSLRDIQAETSKPLPEAKFSERKSMEICKQTEEKNLWKRIKSRYVYPNKKKQNPHSLDRIVVLKSGQKTMQKPPVNVGCHFSYLQSHHSLANKVQIIKPTNFSFRDIRKKLKNARKLKNANSSTNSEKSKPVDLKSSIGDIGASASEKSNLSTVVYSKRQELDIFEEARRHLAERLRQVEKGEASSSQQASRTLERILLSSPKHDLLATLSPKREGTQMRFSPCGNSQVASEKSLQNLKEKKRIEDILSDYGKPVERLQIFDSVEEVQRTDCFMTKDSSSSCYVEIMDTNDFQLKGDVYLSDMASEQNSINTTNRRVGNGCFEGSRVELPFEDKSLKFSSNASLPNTERICKLEIIDSDQDRRENPSPISVLESFFIDNVSSPTSTIESAEPPIQPLHLDFEENSQMVSPSYPKIGLHTCMEDEEFISAYVNTVYQTSQSNWDEFLGRECPRESCDHKLLYDCIKEVLIDLHQCYFGCSPWIITFTKSQIQPVSLERNLVDEVMEKVDWYNLSLTMPRTLDQIVGRDITKSGKWVDIRVDSEDIVIEVVEEALEELIMEVIFDIHF